MITLSTIWGTAESKSLSNVESLLQDFEIAHKSIRGHMLHEETDVLLIGAALPQGVIHQLKWNNDLESVTVLLATLDPEKVTAHDSLRVVPVGTPLDTAEIISASVSVSLPGEYISRHRVAQQLSGHLLEDPLTAREREVLHQISLGKGDEQIAQTLSVSTDTIHTHVKNLRKRLQARSRSHAVTMGHRFGMLPLAVSESDSL